EAFLGVDIGGGGIMVVEIRNDKLRARLSTFGFSEYAPEVIAASTPSPMSLGQDPRAIAETLRAICAQAKVETKRAVTGLPIASVFSSIITLPEMPKKELPAAVLWEAKKLVPMPVEEMILDWKQLEEPATPNASRASNVIRVLLTGAPKALVQQYLAVFTAAGLELLSLETEAFALIRSLVGNDPSVVCILDIGSVRTSMVIVDNATPVFSRSVDIGGRHFTRAIADATGVPVTDAEQMKLDLAVLPTGGAAADVFPALLEQTLAPVIQEVRYGLNLYRSQEEHRGRIVEKIILAGGSSLLPSLVDVFSRTLEIRTFVGDPWARVIYPTDLRPALDALGPRFAVAVGLAMREVS
ncbi:type IV pilus assembly protein PilM, partial [Candidatus Uhrbacteria bacterium]|nr:type IV pilus assembly protein PilM [Candidatus Uhrbacteria bacterium]